MTRYAAIGDETEYSFEHDGAELSREDAARLRQTLKKDPDNLKARLLLLGRGLRSSPRTCAQHLCWLIEKHPHRAVHQQITIINRKLYDAGKESWLKQVELNPDDVTILANSANFLIGNDLQDAAVLLKRACQLDKVTDDLPRQLSHVYKYMSYCIDPIESKSYARKSVEQMKDAIERYSTSSDENSYLLPYFSMELLEIANLAIDHQLYDDAVMLAQILFAHADINRMRPGWSEPGCQSPDLLSAYRAHSILGRTSLRSGNTGEAEAHLRQMMQIRINDALSQYTFVSEIVNIGRNDLAIEFLELQKELLDPSVGNEMAKERARRERESIEKWMKQLKRHGRAGRR